MTEWPPTAADIKAALATHHSKDVFVDECKNGPTWTTAGLSRLDAWVLSRTWSPLTTIGYEIKVTRNDFEHDQKWTQYLTLCHAFYFVCPAGLIKATDLLPGIGLKWMTKSGKIHTKLRAERHEPDTQKLNLLLCYIVMCRTQIIKDTAAATPPGRLELVKRWIEDAEKKKELALLVSGHIRKQYEAMEAQVREAGYMKKTAERFAQDLAELGIVWDPERQEWDHSHEVST